MSRKTRKTLLTAAINEATYGADAIDTGTPKAMLTSGFDLTPIEGDDLERDLDTGEGGHTEMIPVGTHVKASGNIEITGSGTPTTPVAYEPILVGAGYLTTTETGSVEYVRIHDNSEKDVTFYGYKDGAIHIITGARVTFTTNIKVGEIAKQEFEITGLYGGVLAGNVPVADFSAFVKPVKVGHTYTQIQLDGVTYKMLEFSCTEGNEIVYDENTVEEAVHITDWKSEGTILIEAPDIATFDPFTKALDATIMPLIVTHGITAGNIYQFIADRIQLGRTTYGDKEGRLTYSIPYRVIGEHKHVTK
jgi:hypothetical protein